MEIYLYVIIGMSGSFILAVAMLMLYIRYKKTILRQQVQIKNAELQHQKELTQIIIESQENERRQIGKELHDDVGNAIASFRLYLNKHLDALTDDIFKEESNKRIDTIFQKVRTISHQLSVTEIELFGLREAVYMLCEGISASEVLQVRIDESAIKIPDNLEYKTSVIIFRVLQELLTNTIKHARATEVVIRFEIFMEPGQIMIRYSDNGIGLQSTKMLHGMGFKNMESRLQAIGGTFDLPEKAEMGFAMTLSIPFTTAG